MKLNGFKSRRSVAPMTEMGAAEPAEPQPVEAAETPAEPAVPEMSAQERKARLDALRARVEATEAPLVTPAVSPPTVDLNAVRAEIRAEIREEMREEIRRALLEQGAAAEQAERERQEARANGGPCWYCGATQSWTVRDGKRVGHWWGNERRRRCTPCNDDGFGSVYANDSERRAFALKKYLLGDRIPKGLSPDELLEKTGFDWWGRTPNAITAVPRFAYGHANVDAMLEAFKPPPIVLEDGAPCGRCGVATAWRRTKAPVNPWDERLGTVDVLTCHACLHAGDLLQLIASVTGLHRYTVEKHADIASRAYAVTWWDESPAGGKAEPPQPCQTAFGHVDYERSKRKAFELHPDLRAYRDAHCWQQAKRAAEL